MRSPAEYADATMNEHAHQVAVFMWANMAANFGLIAADDPLSYSIPGHALGWNKEQLLPDLQWLHAIHNQGHGDAIRGAQAAAEGVKRGVPDMFLPVPSKPNFLGYALLWLIYRIEAPKLARQTSRQIVR